MPAYGITDLSMPKGWLLPMSLVDMAWGMIATALTAAAGFYLAGHFR